MGPELRVFLLEDCLIDPVPAATSAPKPKSMPHAGVCTPQLIDTAIGGVATLLRKAGEGETACAAGHEVTNLYVADDAQALRVNKKLGCILGVWGKFSGDGKSATDPAVRKLEESGLVPRNFDVGLIFEAALRQTDDGTAHFMDTRHFSVRDFIGESGRAERDFVVTLHVSVPGPTGDGETIAFGSIDLGKRKRGADLLPTGRPADGYPRFRSNLMPLMRISAESKASHDNDVAASRAAGRRYMPVAFNLCIWETDDAGRFLLQLGELLEKARLEGTCASRRAEPVGIADKLYDDELGADLEVREAQKAYDASANGERPVCRLRLERAKRKLEGKAALRLAAGLPARPAIPTS